MTARPTMKKSAQKITTLATVLLLTGAINTRRSGKSMH